MTSKVVVVGAGIIGLSSAVLIQRKCPNVKVTLMADAFDRHTTSNGAGGIFVPQSMNNDQALVDFWADEGSKHFFGLASSSESGTSGVNLVSGFSLQEEDKPAHWLKYLMNVTKLSTETLKRIGPANNKYNYGYICTTVIVEGPKYLPWLMKQFTDGGGEVIVRRIQSFEELAGQYDIVVNCTGLGSRHLANDDDLHPARGHIVRVHAPWIKHFYHMSDHKYILPVSDTIAVGVSKEFGREDLQPLMSDSRRLLAECKDVLPALEGAKVIYDWVGLRPMRSKVRIEPEVMNFKGKQIQVIHNYGHGAFGVSLSWGTGVQVANMVQAKTSPATARL